VRPMQRGHVPLRQPPRSRQAAARNARTRMGGGPRGYACTARDADVARRFDVASRDANDPNMNFTALYQRATTGLSTVAG
jgi:hypothetical protein